VVRPRLERRTAAARLVCAVQGDCTATTHTPPESGRGRPSVVADTPGGPPRRMLPAAGMPLGRTPGPAAPPDEAGRGLSEVFAVNSPDLN
jgi:hypothetical protein